MTPISGEKDMATYLKSTNELKGLLKTGGFDLKGVTVSGEDPPSHLSEDGVLKWVVINGSLKGMI